MPRSGRRHHLILYSYLLNRWWRATLGIGLVLLALAGGLGWLPTLLPQYHFVEIADWVLWFVGGAGLFALLLTILMATIRKSAYIQPFDTHLRLITPFLRLNISYRRILQASSAEMGRLFPPGQFKGRKRALLRPLASKTAIVLVMNGWPLPRWALNLFLSPFFFPDKTSRLALLVPDWILFSNEMESFRGAWTDSLRQPTSSPQSDLLASFSKKKR
jgi:hypothetical protein